MRAAGATALVTAVTTVSPPQGEPGEAGEPGLPGEGGPPVSERTWGSGQCGWGRLGLPPSLLPPTQQELVSSGAHLPESLWKRGA